MLRILQVYKDYCPPIYGGIEKELSLLCNELKHVADVQVLVCNRGSKTQQEIIDGIGVLKVSSPTRLLSAPISPLFPYYLGRERYDILHFHLPNPTAVVSYLIARPKGKLVVTWHSDIVRQAKFLPFYKPFLHRFLELCDVILPTSEQYAKSSPFLDRFISKCQAVPLGIDTSRFTLRNAETDQIIAKLREQHGSRIVLFVGILRYYKGLSYLIQAMQRVDGRLVIVGKGPMEKELKAKVSELGLGAKITFAGAVSEELLPAYYHLCDVFCLPSIYRSEAFGVSQIEAMACGKPVVSTQLDSGVPFVNMHRKTGIIVPPKDSNALAEALNELLSNRALASQMGDLARRRVEREFTAKRMTQSVLAVYSRLLGTN
ncbi:glycosyltransferase [bacterium]|nr:glycosyltransferase [bacterium]